MDKNDPLYMDPHSINMEAVAKCFIKIKKKDWGKNRFIVCLDPNSHTWTNELGNQFRITPDKYSQYTLKDWTHT